MTTTKTFQTSIQQKLFLNNLEGNKQAADLLRLAQAAGMNLERTTIIRKPDGSIDLIERKTR